MHPQSETLWRGSRWSLAVLLALLAMLGPFSIDTYLPAFAGIASSLNATPVQMQQTLSMYLFGYAFMNLFHGALADSFGRRPVILWGLAVFALASVGCALAQTPLQLMVFRAIQGLSCGAGVVVSRTIVRDLFAPTQAQKVMSQITIFFGLAPAIAPMLGAWFFVHWGWESVFWLLVAISAALWIVNWRVLPESLHSEHRQAFSVKNLFSGYWELCRDPRFFLLALASGVPFNGMFLYVLSAPAFLGEILGLEPTQFFWLFLLNISGIMGGAWASGRLAGRIAQRRQVRWGMVIMLVVTVVNLAANLAFTAHASWAMLPLAFYTFGWALTVPVVTLLVLDLNPARRGMASSLQAVVGAAANGVVAGVLAPLVMHSALTMALGSLGLMMVGLVSWAVLRRFWPELGS